MHNDPYSLFRDRVRAHGCMEFLVTCPHCQAKHRVDLADFAEVLKAGGEAVEHIAKEVRNDQ